MYYLGFVAFIYQTKVSISELNIFKRKSFYPQIGCYYIKTVHGGGMGGDEKVLQQDSTTGGMVIMTKYATIVSLILTE